MKEKSKSYITAAKTMYAAMSLLSKNGGTMQGRQLLAEVEKAVDLTSWEREVLASTGNIRWQSIMHFSSVDYVKAGYLIKKKGYWTITPEGEEALKLGMDKMVESAQAAYRAWRAAKGSNPDEEPHKNKEDADSLKENIIGLEILEEQATNGIREFLRGKNPYEFQDMVAAVLKAMGYYIQSVAPKGKDGGVDIVAYVDPLGAQTPRIKVQVKHRPDAVIGAPDIRSLLGVLREGDIALFVTSGSYSPDAKSTAVSSREFIRLIDGDEFIDMWQTYFDKMSDDDKNMLPLRRIAFLGNNE